ncbi:MAG TPA: hypothetical protein VFK89_03235 [Actinomycetota bacterium]|nr:hypothetical protein [Actinomycetota bacterium]
MARARQPDDWTRDLAQARAAEAELAEILAADSRLEDFEDHSGDVDRLDYSFTYAGLHVEVDLKEKRQRYSPGIGRLWPDLPPQDLFIVDETVYRRVVWRGGGGYLVVHDHPGDRWAIFGPWELTLGPRVRYQRWGQRRGESFLKGKLLLNLGAAARVARTFSVDDLLWVILRAAEERDAVEAVALRQADLPEIGATDPG